MFFIIYHFQDYFNSKDYNISTSGNWNQLGIHIKELGCSLYLGGNTSEVDDAYWTISKIIKYCSTKFKRNKYTITCLIRYHLVLNFSIHNL